mmetsp:Transcript_10828/g.12189  ORF Transcript_10828/g.12189 Transcript_10828/m.12189 type:complete len:116 (-) Transcript_10828:509-856(-)
MKYVCDAEKVRRIRRAIKTIRAQKLDEMIECSTIEVCPHIAPDLHQEPQVQGQNDEAKETVCRKCQQETQCKFLQEMRENDNGVNIVDRTITVKEENVFVSGNPKQGLKLKIQHS